MCRQVLDAVLRLRITDHEALAEKLDIPLIRVDHQLKRALSNGYISGAFLAQKRDKKRLFKVARNIVLTPAGMDYLLAVVMPDEKNYKRNLYILHTRRSAARPSPLPVSMQTMSEFLDDVEQQIRHTADVDTKDVAAGIELTESIKQIPLMRNAIRKTLARLGIDLAE